MVIGSDARTDAAEGDFENCRLLVDAAVYIWFLSPTNQPACDYIKNQLWSWILHDNLPAQ